ILTNLSDQGDKVITLVLRLRLFEPCALRVASKIMAEPDIFEVSPKDMLDLGSPYIPSTFPKPCQLVPPCRVGNHGVIAPDRKGRYEKIGKYYFTEQALKHDLGALKRGKVYTKQEFYRRARAWYKADIDRILHWHRVYKEQDLANTKTIEVPRHKYNGTEESIAKTEDPVTGQEEVIEEEKKEEEKKEEEKKEEEKKEEEKKEEEKKEEEIQDQKPKSRTKKVKAPVAPTRIQPPRAAKRKAVEPPLPTRGAKKEKKKIEDTIEAAAPTSPPEAEIIVADEARLRPVDIAIEVRCASEQPVQEHEQQLPEPEPPTDQQQQQNPDGKEYDVPHKTETAQLQPQQDAPEETKGDYQLDLEEWMLFLARYNSATTPVTPTPDPATLSAFTTKQLQGLDVANFIIRLERVIETKINDLFSARQGITIDAGAGGGLCITGFYHHPYKCALDGNYVPPPKFEAAGGYVPGEDWKPEEEKAREQEKEAEGSNGDVSNMKADEKEDQVAKEEARRDGDLKEDDRKEVGREGVREEDFQDDDRKAKFGNTTGVVSSPRYRPPGSGKRSTGRPFQSISAQPSLPGSPGASQGPSIPPLSLEIALHRQEQAALEDDSEEAGDQDELFQLSQQPAAQIPPQLPPLQGLAPRSDIDNPSQNASMRNSPAPEAVMEISPSLGRWQPFTTGQPLENFDDAIVDVAGLRFAIDLCAGYLGDGRSARIFML
ncbi:hypothetical protein V8F20_003886, partial [Naviculisporaceae sp. PSN 640]